MTNMAYTYFDSPVGSLLLVGHSQGLVRIGFPEGKCVIEPDGSWDYSKKHFDGSMKQLAAYFQGKLKTFDLPLLPAGTPFQLAVWEALRGIPYGTTVSYGEIASRIGKPKAVRAVGAANGQNPLPIVVPCHRVIGSDGALTGYGGGLGIKRALLRLEGANLNSQCQIPLKFY
jgi:methylated-DNA-[protein]-cysteine S-methyltransferase